MRRNITGRPLAVLATTGVLVAALVGASVLGSGVANGVHAQSEPVTTVNGIVLPPLVPGVDYDPAEARLEDPAAGADLAGTPAPPALPGDAPAVVDAPDDGGSLTTSLGGSDVAVSSVGGSYEVDRPKKRSNRKR